MPKKSSDKKQLKDFGELRQDITTGKWVVVATGRARRPDNFASERERPEQLKKYVDDCPFCNLAAYPQEPDVVRLPDNADDWQVHVFGNKYPAFLPREEFRAWVEGPYRAMEAVGYHEVLATRWHNQTEALLHPRDVEVVVEALLMRYRQLKQLPSVNYIQIIKNHGEEAGASLEHPHHQIFTIPVLPSDVQDMLWGAERYTQEHGEDPFTAMVRYELDSGERLLWENEHLVAFCPYASRVPFETWIVPRTPTPYFEEIGAHMRAALAEGLHDVLRRLYLGLNNPSYNYFIHSAPCDDTGFVCERKTFQHFSWHIEILPRFGSWGGFELGTGLEITTALPEESAAFLRTIDTT